MAERFDARRVAEIEAEDLEAIVPFGKVRLLCIAARAVARKPRRHDQVRTAAQQLQPRLVADLDATARQQRDTSSEIRTLVALAVVDFRAGGAQLIVEVMELRVLLFADVAMLKLV